MGGPPPASKVFPTTSGRRERLITYGVGYGVGIGVSVALGVSFAIAFGQLAPMLFPVPFVLALGAAYLYRPTGYAVTGDDVSILRPVGSKRIPLDALWEVLRPATSPPGANIGLMRVDGFYGIFGTYWNKAWGRLWVPKNGAY